MTFLKVIAVYNFKIAYCFSSEIFSTKLINNNNYYFNLTQFFKFVIQKWNSMAARGNILQQGGTPPLRNYR